jgi:MFS family permease
MVLTERTGKAIRSPSKSALLAHAAAAVGRGKGFAVHKAMDQVGSFSGPLLVAGLVAVFAEQWVGLAALAVPGAVAMGLLVWIRRRVPDLSVYDAPAPSPPVDVESSSPLAAAPEGLPADFHLYAVACAAITLGLMTFGVISFHLVNDHLLSASAVPLAYAGAMAVAAVTALGNGYAYDRWGGKVLLVLPLLVAAIPALAFSSSVGIALAGVLVWGGANGIQDSTVKALVADLVPQARLATAYGGFAALQGLAALAGGGLAGWLYTGGIGDLVVVIGICQAVALALLLKVLRDTRT